MRHLRVFGRGAVSYYHVVSRVIERRFVLNVEEREHFSRLMRQQELFSGVRVLTWTCLSNHFHLLLAVDDKEAEAQGRIRQELIDDDRAFLERLGHIYSSDAIELIAKDLGVIRLDKSEENSVAEIAKYKGAYLDRMYDLSAFVGELKQRFSQWFNRLNDRKGTLWEERFKSVLVQGDPGLLAMVAAYIDLNPVRAGLVEDPRDWRWCGYSEAASSQCRARVGIFELLGELKRSDWMSVHGRYRSLLMHSALQWLDEAGEVVRKGIPSERLSKEEAGGFRPAFTRSVAWQVRYFSDGLALGSEGFVAEVFEQSGSRLQVKRTVGPRVPKGSNLGGVCTLKDLRGMSELVGDES
ncbi:MAG: transposase [Verrucomicrobiales bacterium]